MKTDNAITQDQVRLLFQNPEEKNTLKEQFRKTFLYQILQRICQNANGDGTLSVEAIKDIYPRKVVHNHLRQTIHLDSMHIKLMCEHVFKEKFSLKSIHLAMNRFAKGGVVTAKQQTSTTLNDEDLMAEFKNMGLGVTKYIRIYRYTLDALYFL